MYQKSAKFVKIMMFYCSWHLTQRLYFNFQSIEEIPRTCSSQFFRIVFNLLLFAFFTSVTYFLLLVPFLSAYILIPFFFENSKVKYFTIKVQLDGKNSSLSDFNIFSMHFTSCLLMCFHHFLLFRFVTECLNQNNSNRCWKFLKTDFLMESMLDLLLSKQFSFFTEIMLDLLLSKSFSLFFKNF